MSSAEAASLHTALRQAADRHVTVVAGTGDIDLVNGASFPLVRGVSLPASDPLVLARWGHDPGRQLPDGAYRGETARPAPVTTWAARS